MPSAAPSLLPDSSRRIRAFGERIRAVRKSQGLSAVEVARRAGIARSTLYNVEAGDAAVTLGAYACVMDALGKGASLDVVLNGDATSTSASRSPTAPSASASASASLHPPSPAASGTTGAGSEFGDELRASRFGLAWSNPDHAPGDALVRKALAAGRLDAIVAVAARSGVEPLEAQLQWLVAAGEISTRRAADIARMLQNVRHGLELGSPAA